LTGASGRTGFPSGACVIVIAVAIRRAFAVAAVEAAHTVGLAAGSLAARNHIDASNVDADTSTIVTTISFRAARTVVALGIVQWLEHTRACPADVRFAFNGRSSTDNWRTFLTLSTGVADLFAVAVVAVIAVSVVQTPAATNTIYATPGWLVTDCGCAWQLRNTLDSCALADAVDARVVNSASQLIITCIAAEVFK